MKYKLSPKFPHVKIVFHVKDRKKEDEKHNSTKKNNNLCWHVFILSQQYVVFWDYLLLGK